MSGGGVPKRWRELSGQNHWNGLLNPLDNDLRKYLLHYGDMVQATYDTFITQNMSRFAGSSRYPMSQMFAGVGLERGNNPMMKYKVTKYLYATAAPQAPGSFMMRSNQANAWSSESNWMGYVAVSRDDAKRDLGRRDIVVAWRGTITTAEWQKDFESTEVSAKQLLKSNNNPMVHQGFYSIYTTSKPNSQYGKTSARDQAVSEVHRLVEQYKNEEISVTVVGHSLGAAVATLNAADIVANGVARPHLEWAKRGILVTAFPFASPRVGNGGFRQTVDQMGVGSNSPAMESGLDAGRGQLRILRIVNRPDTVPQTPPTIANFTHVGQLFQVDSNQSAAMGNPQAIGVAHDMEVYLHAIAGARRSLEGLNQIEVEQVGFRDENDRDISLVNKYTNGLKTSCFVFPNWWVTQNKGMIQQPNGKWIMEAGNWILGGHHLDEDETEDSTSGGHHLTENETEDTTSGDNHLTENETEDTTSEQP